jgi:hypothetical protein
MEVLVYESASRYVGSMTRCPQQSEVQLKLCLLFGVCFPHQILRQFSTQKPFHLHLH